MKKVVALLLVLMLALPCTVFGRYLFTHYDSRNGLSQNSITAIVQDKTGFMWFGTKNGLNRFDGKEFRVYRRGNDGHSLGRDYVNSLYVSSDNKLWVGTDMGVYVFDPQQDCFTKLSLKSRNGVSISSNVRLMAGKGPYIYISSSSQGLFRYDQRTHKLVNYPMNGFPPVTGLAFDDGNRIWIGLYGKGLSYTLDNFKNIHPFVDSNGKEVFTGQTICSIVPAEQGRMYVGSSSNGITEVNLADRTVRSLLPRGDSKGNFVHSLVRNGNEIWAATEGGLYIYELLTHELLHYSYEPTNAFSLSDNPVQCIYRNREGGMWVGSYFGGINYAPRHSDLFEKFFPRVDVVNSLHGRRVREFVEDSRHRIWIGTEDGGLNCYDIRSGAISHIRASDAFPNIHCLCLIGDRLWTGTFAYGLKVIDTNTGSVVKSYAADGSDGALIDNCVYSVYYSRKEGQVYVGTFSGLCIYSPATNKFRRVVDVPANIVYDILADRYGNLWVAVYGEGVWRRNAAGKWSRYSLKDKAHRLNNDNVVSVFESSRGDIWITTEGGGVSRYYRKSDRFEPVSIPKDQPRRVVYQIREDESGLLWMSTDNGLMCYNPVDGSCKIYTTANGLLDNNFNYSSSLKGSDGRIYMGSYMGFIAFDPSSFHESGFLPNIVATELWVNNGVTDVHSPNSPLKEDIAYTRKLVLSHDRNSFSLKVAVLSFGNTSSKAIEYRLEGFDKQWQRLYDNKYIKYTNLPSGTYLLKVRAVTSGGKLTAKEYELEIEVRPPVYLTWWATMLYIVLGLLLACAVYHYLNQRSRMRRRLAMEKFEYEKEQELYQSKINFFTNVAHEIRTPLTLIKGPLEDILHRKGSNRQQDKEDLTIMDRNVSRLLDLTNQLLDFRKTERNGLRLNFERCDIGKLVDSVYVRFTPLIRSKGIVSRFTRPDSPLYAYVDKEGFTKIISNLINNAVKYCDRFIHIELYLDGTRFHVKVENDGNIVRRENREKIFAPFFRLDTKANASTTGTGIGLALARTLAELHEGSLAMDPGDNLNIFHLTMPVNHEPTISVTADDSPAAELSPYEEDDRAAEPGTTVLIVEDNMQMQAYEKRMLQSRYRVLSATDGEAALRVLKANEVDIIVSDAMMEPMGGFELCRSVKQDINYSHIPFILLTALTIDSAKIEGMESGADSYIEKPFSMDYLLSVIDNLLRQRATVKKAYADSPFTPAATISISKADEQFVSRLNGVMQEHMADSDFGIAQLASEMAMSRSGLNRKIRGVFNLSPNNYIKLERLKRAAYLMKSSSAKVNEVSFLVGFSSPSYFTQCFYKQFGLLPKDFINQNTSEKKKE